MSAYDPEKMEEQRKLAHESTRAEFARREALQRSKFEDALAAIREPSTRSPEKVAEIRARLEQIGQPPFEVVDLDS
ncbi:MULTISPECIES: hypothetical protein [Mycobacterium]|uniref:hypothetical protein n=1 Tax=Mycobacterium TaxID=1763 RepID=UPI001EF13113|nr:MULTISPECIES: hypothetical protein [Mycobacterium]GLD03558.1 hypothetical protein Mkiyose1088_54240 [Mycobacterium kiyosense]